jgi:hypothetical protein
MGGKIGIELGRVCTPRTFAQAARPVQRLSADRMTGMPRMEFP